MIICGILNIDIQSWDLSIYFWDLCIHLFVTNYIVIVLRFCICIVAPSLWLIVTCNINIILYSYNEVIDFILILVLIGVTIGVAMG